MDETFGLRFRMKLSKDEMLAWMLEKVKTSTNAYDAESWLVTARTLGVNFEVDVSVFGSFDFLVSTFFFSALRV